MQSASGPRPPGSVRHYPTIPLVRGHAGGPALPPATRCAGVWRPRARALQCACAPDQPRRATPSLSNSAAKALAPVCANGLSLSKPGPPDAQAPLHTLAAFLCDSVPQPTLLQDFSIPSPPFGHPLASLSPPITLLLWLQGRFLRNPARVLSPTPAGRFCLAAIFFDVCLL